MEAIELGSRVKIINSPVKEGIGKIGTVCFTDLDYKYPYFVVDDNGIGEWGTVELVSGKYK